MIIKYMCKSENELDEPINYFYTPAINIHQALILNSNEPLNEMLMHE